MTVFDSVFMVIHATLALVSGSHALLNKRDPRAALSWIVVCIFFPIIGPMLYFWFGINRVQLRARRLLKKNPIPAEECSPYFDKSSQVSLTLDQQRHCQSLINIANAVTQWPLLDGNKIEILENGNQAYPEMLEAIRNAKKCVYLITYIFDTDKIGMEFIDALEQARHRNVDVKILIDGIGELGLHSRASTLLKKKGIEVSRYLPISFRPPAIFWNLRNHRKLLIVDKSVAFTGGMNISERHLVEDNKVSGRVTDIHFKVSGAILSQLEKVFIEDWHFATGIKLKSESTLPEKVGNALCRTIVDGPSYDVDKLAMILIGAVSAAQNRIIIMTPYFLPSRELIAALQSASLRGVKVDILLPEQSDSRVVDWASKNMLWQLLQFDIQVHYQPPPFAHSKIFVVDSYYLLVGSANIDPRSLRLNFELNLEIYDQQLVNTISNYVDRCMAKARKITFDEVESRPYPQRFRDGLAWLFSPYL